MFPPLLQHILTYESSLPLTHDHPQPFLPSSSSTPTNSGYLSSFNPYKNAQTYTHMRTRTHARQRTRAYWQRQAHTTQAQIITTVRNFVRFFFQSTDVTENLIWFYEGIYPFFIKKKKPGDFFVFSESQRKYSFVKPSPEFFYFRVLERMVTQTEHVIM